MLVFVYFRAEVDAAFTRVRMIKWQPSLNESVELPRDSVAYPAESEGGYFVFLINFAPIRNEYWLVTLMESDHFSLEMYVARSVLLETDLNNRISSILLQCGNLASGLRTASDATSCLETHSIIDRLALQHHDHRKSCTTDLIMWTSLNTKA